MDYFYARYYNAAEGRFLSADVPLLDQYPSDPQSWNLYGYVRNNPLINVDSTGHGLRCTTTYSTGPDGRLIASVTCVEVPDPPDGGSFGGGGGGLGGVGGFGGGGHSGPVGNPPGSAPRPSLLSFFGIRAAGQTYANCLVQNLDNYSVAGVLNIQSESGNFVLGNDVSQILFGDSSGGTGGLLLWEGGSRSFKIGVGEAMTAGRRTASILDLNLAGKTGPAVRILGKTGAGELAEWLSGVAELKMAGDIGLTGAEAIGCLVHR